MRAIILFVALIMLGAAGLLYSTSRISASDFSAEHEVVIFTAPWCGYCNKARAHLNEREVNFLEIDIESSANASQQWRDAGGRGVPLAFFQAQRISGYSRSVYAQLIDEL